MKGKKKYDAELEFRVPLPEEARDVIDRAQSLAGRNGWGSSHSRGAGKPMSYNTLPKVHGAARVGLPTPRVPVRRIND